MRPMLRLVKNLVVTCFVLALVVLGGGFLLFVSSLERIESGSSGRADGIVALTGRPEHRGKAVLLLGLDGVRFRRPITPGDRVVITVVKIFEKRGIWKFDARAEVDGQRVAEGELMATVADRKEQP